MNGGDIYHLESCDPGELVQLVCLSCPKLAQLYWQAHRQKPCSRARPWRAIIGFDEFLPGNPTAGQHAKKTMCTYFNFIELGHASLVEGATWFCPIIFPTEMEARVSGGWSRVLADFLERFCFGPTGFLTAGAAITLDGETFVLYATIHILISDGDGLKKAFAWRGASSMRPCFKHDNVLRKGSGLLERLPRGWFEITHGVAADFHLRRAGDFFDSADKVAAACRRMDSGRLGIGMFNEICKSEALNYHEQALPWRFSLRCMVYVAFYYDWVHTMLQDGPLNIELFEYLNLCRDFVWFDVVREWLQLPWVFPKAYRGKGNTLWKVFSEWRANRNGDHDKLHCSASELLGSYSLVRLLLELRVPDSPERAAAKESFLLCCRIVDLFQRAKKMLITASQAADLLETTLQRFFQKHKEAYGDEFIRPKFHWVFDLIEQLRKHELVFDQLIVERLHLWIKKVAEMNDNMRRWERGVLAGALNHQVQDLQLMQGPCHIMDNRVLRSELYPNAQICNNIRVMGMHLATDDVVFWNDRAGKIVLCGRDGEFFFAILELWEPIQAWTEHASVWNTSYSGRREVANALDIEMVSAWRKLDNIANATLVVRH